jgi:hypothetical protein
MSSSSERDRGRRARLIDKPTAWACAAANAAALPGLGTVAAGRRVGYLQAALALLGFALTLLGLVGIIRDWSRDGALPDRITSSLWVGLAGIAVYAAAWLWALSSSLRIHRQAPSPTAEIRPAERPPPVLSTRSRSGPLPPRLK